LIVFERTGHYFRVAAVVTIAFTAGAHKFHFEVVELYLGGAIGFEKSNRRRGVKAFGHGMGKGDAIAHAYDISVFGFPADKLIAHKTTDDITGRTQLFGCMGNFIEYE
jgi:hypothetical protein